MFPSRPLRLNRHRCSLGARLPAVLWRGAALSWALFCFLRAGWASQPRDFASLQITPEWGRLTRLWQRLLDHSEQRIHRAEEFSALAKDLETAQTELENLARTGALGKEVADELVAVLRGRYEYIKEHQYNPGSHFSMSALEAAVNASEWVVEMQLAVLRRARPPTPQTSGEGAVGSQPPQGQVPSASLAGQIDPKLAKAVRSNLEFELTFLHHYRDFQAGLLRRRAELAQREQEGGTADWPAFDAECETKRGALLSAYQKRNLPSVRSVRAIIPHLVALTEAEASQTSPRGPAEGGGM